VGRRLALLVHQSQSERQEEEARERAAEVREEKIGALEQLVESEVQARKALERRLEELQALILMGGRWWEQEGRSIAPREAAVRR